jgi:hypothetical protein
MTGLPLKNQTNLLILGLFFISILLFVDVIIFDKYPVTSADPAIKYWSAVYNSQNITNGDFSLWSSSAGVGQSVFFNSILQSPLGAPSIFLSFFEDKAIGFSIYLWIQFLVFLILIGTVTKKTLKLSPISIFTVSIISVFSAAILNEYLFNGFSGYLLFPLMLYFINQANEDRGDIFNAIYLGIILAISHWLSNVAVVQFSLIFFGFMVLYLWLDFSNFLSSFWRPVKFMLIATIVWAGLMSFWLFPFVTELISSTRSHAHNIYGGYTLFSIVKLLLAPFTSWVFIDEKMITTGLLTRFESLNLYISMLLLPTIIYFLLNKHLFKKFEKFFFYYTFGYLFLAWLNQYVPLLGLLVELTKGTGWWRSYPLFVFSAAISIGLVVNILFKDLDKKAREVNYLLKKGVDIFSFIYLISGVLLLLLFVFWVFIPDVFLNFLQLFSDRPKDEIAKYFEYYYFTSPVFYWILIIPFSSSLILWIWSKAYSSGGELSKYWPPIFIIALLFLHFSLIHIYYPMNSGIKKNDNLSETRFIEALSKDDRLLILKNDQSEIEKQYGAVTNFESAINISSIPEFSRYQSNVNFRGNFFRTLGEFGVYSEGSNLTPKYLNNFHMEVIKDDKQLVDKFSTNKGYLLTGQDSVNSPLIDIASVSHIASSLPINDQRLKFIHKGDQYLIYKNTSSFPKFFLSKPKQEDNKYQTEYALDVGQGFYEPNIVNGEIKVNGLTDYSLDIKSPVDSVLVVNDLYHDGWKASLNGKSIDIFRVNYLFKGVNIPSGSHQLVMTFSASNFWLGVSMSLISLFIILALLFRGNVYLNKGL